MVPTFRISPTALTRRVNVLIIFGCCAMIVAAFPGTVAGQEAKPTVAPATGAATTAALTKTEAIDSKTAAADATASEGATSKTTEVVATEPAKSEADQPAEDTYQLRYKFQPNQTLKYETKQTIIQTGVAPFGQQVETNKIEQRRVYTITNVADAENATASMQFEYVRMERDMGKNPPIVFDTKMKLDDVPKFFRHAAKSLKKKAPTYELKAKGINTNEDQVEQTPTGGQATFVVPMPEAAKSIGESWTTFVEVKVRLAEQMFRTVKLRKTFRLKSVDNGIAEISMSTSTVGAVKDTRVRVQLLQATPSGTIWFDVDRGLVTKKEIRFSNTVLNAMGPKTMVSAKGRTIERLL